MQVYADDMAALLVVEECCHRFDIKVHKVEPADTVADRTHILEKNAKTVVRQAIQDMRIPTFKVRNGKIIG